MVVSHPLRSDLQYNYWALEVSDLYFLVWRAAYVSHALVESQQLLIQGHFHADLPLLPAFRQLVDCDAMVAVEQRLRDCQ